MSKKQKIECHTCGHFNMINTDNGWVKGCSAFSLYYEEMRNDFEEDGKRMDVTIAPIDTTFILNKDDDCIVWLEQTPLQKQRVAELQKARKWLFWKRLKAIVFGNRNAGS